MRFFGQHLSGLHGKLLAAKLLSGTELQTQLTCANIAQLVCCVAGDSVWYHARIVGSFQSGPTESHTTTPRSLASACCVVPACRTSRSVLSCFWTNRVGHLGSWRAQLCVLQYSSLRAWQNLLHQSFISVHRDAERLLTVFSFFVRIEIARKHAPFLDIIFSCFHRTSSDIYLL